MTLYESVVEDAALAWLEALGYSVLHGPDIAAGEPGAERNDSNYRDVLLERRLRQALVRLNPDLPPEALEDAYRKLTRVDAQSLVERNRAVHRMLVNGVTVEYRRHARGRDLDDNPAGAVDRARIRQARRATGESHLHHPGGLVGEGDGEDLAGPKRARGDLPGDPARDRRRLARAGPREDANRPAHSLGGAALLGIQTRENDHRATGGLGRIRGQFVTQVARNCEKRGTIPSREKSCS